MEEGERRDPLFHNNKRKMEWILSLFSSKSLVITITNQFISSTQKLRRNTFISDPTPVEER